MIRSTITFFIFIIVSGISIAQETKITVLGVKVGTANELRAKEFMTYLKQNWLSTTGVSIHLVNDGYPVILSPNNYTGTGEQQLISIKQHPEWNNYREAFAADIMIVFTPKLAGAGECGRAIQVNWTGDPGSSSKFDDSADGIADNMDTSGADESYYAIVATGADNDCESFHQTALHEFGHLLGAGHTLQSSAPGHYLESDSHAHVKISILTPPYGTGDLIGEYTFITERDPPACSQTIQCTLAKIFSHQNGTADNQKTIRKTAKSVANYRTTNPGGGSSEPPDCSLTPPTILFGSLKTTCDAYNRTIYSLVWGGGCPSVATHWEIWKQQPLTSSFVYGWTKFSPETEIAVWGSTGKVKVKACNSTSCSGMSIDEYTVTPKC